MFRNPQNAIGKKLFLKKIKKNLKILYKSKNSSIRCKALKFLNELQPEIEDYHIICEMFEINNKNITFFVLQLLEQILTQKWNFFPPYQKKLLFSLIIKKIFFFTSRIRNVNELFSNLNKLNSVLIKMVSTENKKLLFHLLSDLASSAKISETVCENNLRLVQLILEDFFKSLDLKKKNLQFQKLDNIVCLKRIENLSCFIFQQSCFLVKFRPGLIINALNVFEKILVISKYQNYQFISLSLDSLISLCFEKKVRNHALNCLFELENHYKESDLSPRKKIIQNLLIQFQEILPISFNFVDLFANSENEFRFFIMNSIVFFLKIGGVSGVPIEKKFYPQCFFLIIHQYFLKISCLPNLELLKICLDWWKFFFYKFEEKRNSILIEKLSNCLFIDLIVVLTGRMAKPEEILIRENGSGEVIRETIIDTDSNVLYEKIKKVLIVLVKLEPSFSQQFFLKKLSLQFQKTYWNRKSLSSICWSIGSISNAFSPEEEKKFLVNVIKDLLFLCEVKKGKDNKAVIACNIMFIVGAYPQFLQNHRKFLKTVLQKLFEFMKESHPGIKDMASDTFLKLGKSCSTKISFYCENGETPLMEEIFENAKDLVKILEFRQKRQLFETLAILSFSFENSSKKNCYILKIFTLLNDKWFTFLKFQCFHQKFDLLSQVSMILKLNQLIGDLLKNSYNFFLGKLIKEVFFLYFWASEKIFQKICYSKKQEIQILKGLRSNILNLVQVYFLYLPIDLEISKIEKIFHSLVVPILLNYKVSTQNGQNDSGVLEFCKIILLKKKNIIQREMIRVIFSHTLIPSLNFINTNFEDNMDLRKNFFSLLRILILDFFPEIFKLDNNPVKAEKFFEIIIHSLIWGFKHFEKEISKKSIESLLYLVDSIGQESLKHHFFLKFFKQLMNDLFSVMIDGLHFSCFKLQGKLFFKLFQISKEYSENSVVQTYLLNFFTNSFLEMGPDELEKLVSDLLNETDEEKFRKKIFLGVKFNPIFQEESSSID